MQSCRHRCRSRSWRHPRRRHRRASTMHPQQCRRSTQHVNAHNTHDNETSRSTNASLREHQAAPRRQRTHASAERGWTNTGQELTCRSPGPLVSTRMSMARVRKRPWHASTTNCCAASPTRSVFESAPAARRAGLRDCRFPCALPAKLRFAELKCSLCSPNAVLK